MTRDILGTGLIVLTMVLTAWVAINEPTRIEQYNAQFAGRAIENGAASFEQYCVSCHGLQGEGVGGLGPPLYPRLFTEREPQLKAERWGGGIDDFIELTIAGGRPVRSVDFADAGFAETMPTWSQRYGGPTREDQIRDLVAFIMNWREQAGQPAPTPAAPAGAGNFPPAEPLPAGDPARGQALLNGDQRSGVTGAPLPCSAATHPGRREGRRRDRPSLAGIATTAGQRQRGLPGPGDRRAGLRARVDRPAQRLHRPDRPEDIHAADRPVGDAAEPGRHDDQPGPGRHHRLSDDPE
jgi:mono/diheme cytochrome c family protein